MLRSFGAFLPKDRATFPVQKPVGMIEVQTHDTDLKKQLTAPYSEERKQAAGEWAEKKGLKG